MENVLHYYGVGADTVGTTIDSPESVGTLKTLNKPGVQIHGFIFQVGSTATRTTAEAVTGNFILDTEGLTRYTLYVPIAAGDCAPPATNEGSIYDYGKWFPFSPLTENQSNWSIVVKYDALKPEPTTEVYARATILYSVGAIDTNVLLNNGFGFTNPKTHCDWSKVTIDDDIYDAATEALEDTITVPQHVRLLTAIGIKVMPDAVPTAGEHLAGYLALTSDAGDHYPMQIPFPLHGATLGTPVDTRAAYEIVRPLHLPMPPSATIVTLTANLAATATGAYAVEATLYGVV